MLLGSKSDLDSRREVTTEEGQKVCQTGQVNLKLCTYLYTICFVDNSRSPFTFLHLYFWSLFIILLNALFIICFRVIANFLCLVPKHIMLLVSTDAVRVINHTTPPPTQFADHHDITHFYEVSAKTGENVTESFEAFFRDIHRKVSLLTE